MNELVKGIIHVHSNFSRDGLCSIAELADFAREAGFNFIGLTDHAEDLSSEDLKSLRRECEKHCDESLVIIPGLEFRCHEDIDILGLGITDKIPSMDPVIVARQVRSLGGVAILAHPSRKDYECPMELCGVLNGIEIWNAAYDGSFVPPPASLCLLQEARTVNLAICAYGGVDLHWLDDRSKATIELQAKGPTPVNGQMVLECLRSGSFIVRGRYVVFDAHAFPNWLTRSSLWAFRKFYEIATAIRHAALGGA